MNTSFQDERARRTPGAIRPRRGPVCRFPRHVDDAGRWDVVRTATVAVPSGAAARRGSARAQRTEYALPSPARRVRDRCSRAKALRQWSAVRDLVGRPVRHERRTEAGDLLVDQPVGRELRMVRAEERGRARAPPRAAAARSAAGILSARRRAPRSMSARLTGPREPDEPRLPAGLRYARTSKRALTPSTLRVDMRGRLYGDRDDRRGRRSHRTSTATGGAGAMLSVHLSRERSVMSESPSDPTPRRSSLGRDVAPCSCSPASRSVFSFNACRRPRVRRARCRGSAASRSSRVSESLAGTLPPQAAAPCADGVRRRSGARSRGDERDDAREDGEAGPGATARDAAREREGHEGREPNGHARAAVGDPAQPQIVTEESVAAPVPVVLPVVPETREPLEVGSTSRSASTPGEAPRSSTRAAPRSTPRPHPGAVSPPFDDVHRSPSSRRRSTRRDCRSSSTAAAGTAGSRAHARVLR